MSSGVIVPTHFFQFSFVKGWVIFTIFFFFLFAFIGQRNQNWTSTFSSQPQHGIRKSGRKWIGWLLLSFKTWKRFISWNRKCYTQHWLKSCSSLKTWLSSKNLIFCHFWVCIAIRLNLAIFEIHFLSLKLRKLISQLCVSV